MPVWTLSESLGAGSILGEDANVIKDNFKHMAGIVRYIFEVNAAKNKVAESVELVNPSLIPRLQHRHG